MAVEVVGIREPVSTNPSGHLAVTSISLVYPVGSIYLNDEPNASATVFGFPVPLILTIPESGVFRIGIHELHNQEKNF